MEETKIVLGFEDNEAICFIRNSIQDNNLSVHANEASFLYHDITSKYLCKLPNKTLFAMLPSEKVNDTA